MKEFISLAVQIIFILTGFGVAFCLLYFAFKSPGKDKIDHFDLLDTDKKEKFIGRT